MTPAADGDRSQRFPPRYRVRTRREFVALQRDGRRQSAPHFIVITSATPGPDVRLGITTSRKVGNSPARNRIRRLVRGLRPPALDELGLMGLIVIATRSLSMPMSSTSCPAPPPRLVARRARGGGLIRAYQVLISPALGPTVASPVLFRVRRRGDCPSRPPRRRLAGTAPRGALPSAPSGRLRPGRRARSNAPMEQRRVSRLAISLLIVGLPGVVHRLYPPWSRPRRPSRRRRPPCRPSAKSPPPPTRHAPAIAPELAAAARDVVVDTNLTAPRSPPRRAPEGLRAKHYRTTVAPDSPPLQLIQLRPPSAAAGRDLLRRGPPAAEDASRVYTADQTAVDLGPTTVDADVQRPTARRHHRHQEGHAARSDYLWTLDVETGSVPAGYTQMSVGWYEGMNPAGPKPAKSFRSGRHPPEEQAAGASLREVRRRDPDRMKSDIDWMASAAATSSRGGAQAEETNDLRVWMRREQDHVESVPSSRRPVPDARRGLRRTEGHQPAGSRRPRLQGGRSRLVHLHRPADAAGAAVPAPFHRQLASRSSS